MRYLRDGVLQLCTRRRKVAQGTTWVGFLCWEGIPCVFLLSITIWFCQLKLWSVNLNSKNSVELVQDCYRPSGMTPGTGNGLPLNHFHKEFRIGAIVSRFTCGYTRYCGRTQHSIKRKNHWQLSILTHI